MACGAVLGFGACSEWQYLETAIIRSDGIENEGRMIGVIVSLTNLDQNAMNEVGFRTVSVSAGLVHKPGN